MVNGNIRWNAGMNSLAKIERAILHDACCSRSSQQEQVETPVGLKQNSDHDVGKGLGSPSELSGVFSC